MLALNLRWCTADWGMGSLTKWTACDHKQLCVEDLGNEKLTLSGKTMMVLLTKTFTCSTESC